jgi:hypothetical protein
MNKERKAELKRVAEKAVVALRAFSEWTGTEPAKVHACAPSPTYMYTDVKMHVASIHPCLWYIKCYVCVSL